MKTISMLQFRRAAEGVLKQVAKGHAFVLTYRGKAVARLEPVLEGTVSADDPIYQLGEIASDKLQPLTNAQIDGIVYGA